MMLTLAAGLVGLLTGVATSGLLYALAWATATRESIAWLPWLLAPAGALIGYVYQTYGRAAAPGNSLIIDEIHAPKGVIPFRMAPLILFSTTLTHLVGGSAGREGSAVQVGGALAERVARWFRLTGQNRRTLLAAGLSAGFAAAIGAPFAGALFGLEVLAIGGWRLRSVPFATLAAWIAALTAHALRAPHANFPHAAVVLSAPSTWAWTAAAGIIFGLVTRVFITLTHALAKVFSDRRLPAPVATAAGGLILSICFVSLGYGRYAGLGLDVIQSALAGPVDARDWIFKLGFTALTLGAGFKGGEFIPLVFIGSTLGSALAAHAGSVPLAALGFAAVFGAAAHTPFACAVMAAELFGIEIFPPALLACVLADLCSVHPGIYAGQPRRSLSRLLRHEA